MQADFANLFAVKEGRTDSDGEIRAETRDGVLALSYRRGTVNRGIELHCRPHPASIGEDIITFEAIVPPHGDWTACLEVHPVLEGSLVAPRYRCGQPVERATPAERLAAMAQQGPAGAER